MLIEEKIDYNDLVPSTQDDTASEDKEESLLPDGGNKKLASKGGTFSFAHLVFVFTHWSMIWFKSHIESGKHVYIQLAAKKLCPTSSVILMKLQLKQFIFFLSFFFFGN